MNARKALPLLALLALIPLLPCVLFGYAGHDFTFHVASWMELRDAWRAGQPTPAWAARANFTLGDPRFCFYPPLSLRLGGLLALLLPFRLVPGAMLWLALFLAGACMYLAAGPLLAPKHRLPAAILYMLSPYLLTTALVRFAPAELLVQAWLPLLLLCFYQALAQRSRRALLLLAALLALSWLTNIPASTVLLYALAGVAALLAWQQRSPRPLIALLFAEALAASLAAFYLLPVWLERTSINQQDLVRIGTLRFLLFIPSNFSGYQPLKLFKWTCWLFACAYLLLILATRLRRKPATPSPEPTRTWLALALLAFFFQTPFAFQLWQSLPQLRSAEFPFRFLPLMAVTLPWLLFAPDTNPALRRPSYALLALLATLPVLEHIELQRDPRTHRPPLSQTEADWQLHGYPGVPEYLPALAPTQPQSPPTPTCQVTSLHLPTTFIVTSTPPCQALLPLYFNPSWQARDESYRLPTAAGPSNRLLVTLPPATNDATHTVSLRFEPASPARTASRVLSLAALLGTVLALAKTRIEPNSAAS